MIEVLLIDDHHLFREGLTRIIQEAPGMRLAAAVQSGDDVFAVLLDQKPDVIIMDINVSGMRGMEIVQKIRELQPDIPILILTVSEVNEFLFDAVRAGVRGYLLKNASSQELLEAVRLIAAGEAVISPKMAIKLFDEFAALSSIMNPGLESDDNHTNSITARESEVLKLVARGMSNKEIGSSLSISPLTVKSHIGAILEKLELRGRVEAAAWAIRHGLLRTE